MKSGTFCFLLGTQGWDRSPCALNAHLAEVLPLPSDTGGILVSSGPSRAMLLEGGAGVPVVVPAEPARRRCCTGLSRSASLPKSQSAVPRGGCQGWYCRHTNAQLYVLLTRGVTDGPVSVQAGETGAHSGCSQSIAPLWGELQAGLGGLEPAATQGCLLGLPPPAAHPQAPR